MHVTTYFAVCKIINLLTDVVNIRFWFIVRGTAGDVVVGFRQSNDGSLQSDKDGLSQCGMIRLWVVVLYLIHPTLQRYTDFTWS